MRHSGSRQWLDLDSAPNAKWSEWYLSSVALEYDDLGLFVLVLPCFIFFDAGLACFSVYSIGDIILCVLPVLDLKMCDYAGPRVTGD
jgi:hypothetical protein